MVAPIEIFALGACLLHGPLAAAMREGAAASSFSRFPNGTIPSVYTIDEALQLVRFLKGERDIPAELRPYCSILPGIDPRVLPGGALDTADVVILEVNSPVRIEYRGYSLSRAEIIDRIFAPIRDISQEIYRAIDVWYTQGLMGADKTLREAGAKVLIPALPDNMVDVEMARSILSEATSHIRTVDELAEGISALRELIQAPLGMMTYTHQYLPDGRPLPWPPEFVEQQIEAATRLELPYFQPSRVIRKEGVAQALQEDRVHYQDRFQPIMGNVLVEFSAHLVDSARRQPTATAPKAPTKSLPIEAFERLLTPPYQHVGGKLWLAELPPGLHDQTDTSEAPQRSELRLLENEHALQPGHTMHETIEHVGGGSHSFWRTVLYFSTSDGSDPNTNGRIYAVAGSRHNNSESKLSGRAIDAAGEAAAIMPIADKVSSYPHRIATGAAPGLAVGAPGQGMAAASTVQPGVLIFPSTRVHLESFRHPAMSEKYWDSSMAQEPDPVGLLGTFPIPGQPPREQPNDIGFGNDVIEFPSVGEYYFYCHLGAFKVLVLDPKEPARFNALKVFAFVSRNTIHSRSDAWLCAREGHDGAPFYWDRLVEKLFFSDQPLQLHCGYASNFTGYLLHSQGMTCRLVALTGGKRAGHILLEVWDPEDDNWIALDPDFGVAVAAKDGRLLSAEQIALHVSASNTGDDWGDLQVVDLAKKTWNKASFDFPLRFTGQVSWRPECQMEVSAAQPAEYLRSWRDCLGTVKYERFEFDASRKRLTWAPWSP
jgi:hypothetical protein